MGARSTVPSGVLILGVDGGGTKTRALLSEPSGNVVATGGAGSSNPHSMGFDAATANIAAAIADARKKVAGAPIAAAAFGLAGIDSPEVRPRVTAWLETQGFAPRIAGVTDGELGLAAGTPEGWGLALICGTGALCYGRTRH
ncbi:MAG: BadF/BadG/BcrA/BcrD ATPase family protein, partial [Myxococcaceae bacterium]